MQANKAQTFPELWASLNTDDKQKIARELIYQGYVNSHQTIYGWGAGRTRPATLAARRGVAKLLNDILGTDYNENLFSYEK